MTRVTQLRTGFEADISGFDDSFSSASCTTVRDASAARSGGWGLLHTTTAIDGVQASAVRSGFDQPTGRVTTDVWFYIVGSGDAGYEIATEGWTGSRRHLTSFRWIDDTGFTERWQYWTAAGAWSAVPGAAVTLTRDAWHHVVCVMDWELLEYIELVVDDVVYPMTGIPIDDTVDAAAAFMQATMLAWTHEASILTAYSDDFKLSFGKDRSIAHANVRSLDRAVRRDIL